MNIEKKMLFKLAVNVKTRKEDFGLLIVSKTTPALSLNEDGTYLWYLIDGKNTVGAIISKLEEKFDNSNLEGIVIKFLDTLLNVGLIELVK